MKQFTVYFQLFDKRMKTTVQSETPYGAIEQVKKKLEILEVREVKEDTAMMDFLNGFKSKHNG